MDALPSVLARLFLESMILGGAIDLFAVLVQIFNLLIFTDSLQTMRKRTLGRVLLLAFEDVVFCLIVAVGMLLLAFSGTNGVIRWIFPVGTFIGFLVARKTIGVILRRASVIIAVYLRKIIAFAFRVLSWPFRFFSRFVRRIFACAKRIAKKIIKSLTEKRKREEKKEGGSPHESTTIKAKGKGIPGAK